MTFSGPPDTLFLVDAFWLSGSYTGTTAQGIGVGSISRDVLDAFGEPRHKLETPNSDRYFSYYCMGRRSVTLYIDTDTVRSFFIGFNEPVEGYYIECD